MQRFFRVLLSPLTFAVGFLWPLVTQSVVALGYLPFGWQSVVTGAVIAIPFGLMAQFRGSWIWIR